MLASTLFSCADSVPTELKTSASVSPQPMVVRAVTEATSSAAIVPTAFGVLPTYSRVSGIAGNLSSNGSDTLANLMTLWTEAFKRTYSSVNIQVQAAGSSTAPPALTEGTANFGPMSRPMKDSEIESFEARHGYKPTGVRVALDALAVFVHKDNPLNELTLTQIDSLFSVTRRCSANANISRWGQLGLQGSWSNRPVQLYGRNSVSGTYGYFKKLALCSGDFKNTVNEQPGSASVVQAVASSLNGVGYSGIGYITSGVKALAIAQGSSKAVAASAEDAVSGDYPLTRYLYVYINKKPDTPLSALETEFLRLVLSKEGQEIVKKDGYIPVSAEVAQRELQKLN